MSRRRVAVVAVGVIVAGLGLLAIAFPAEVAVALGRPYETAAERINARATWGGTALGLGAALLLPPRLRPWWAPPCALLACTMAGIGVARLIGFALDGAPDALQWVYLVAEIALVGLGAFGWRRAGNTENTR